MTKERLEELENVWIRELGILPNTEVFPDEGRELIRLAKLGLAHEEMGTTRDVLLSKFSRLAADTLDALDRRDALAEWAENSAIPSMKKAREILENCEGAANGADRALQGSLHNLKELPDAAK